MRPFVLAAVLGVALVVVGCAYQPGSFNQPYTKKAFTGQRVTVGCLDVAVEREWDRGSWAVLDFSFGNRCDKAATVDLAWAQVVGRTTEGNEIALAPYDPKSELRVLRLDGRVSGREVLAYPADVSLGQVCVDVASLAHQKPAQWVCFGNLVAVAMAEVAP